MATVNCRPSLASYARATHQKSRVGEAAQLSGAFRGIKATEASVLLVSGRKKSREGLFKLVASICFGAVVLGARASCAPEDQNTMLYGTCFSIRAGMAVL